MIGFDKTQVTGWEPAIRGMRNPMNSWAKSDSEFRHSDGEYHDILENTGPSLEDEGTIIVGDNDLALMKKLAKAGPVDAKYRRMLVVYVDITAPLYFWKEFDTYKVGTVANSCSTMHKIHEKKFVIDDFSHEHLFDGKDAYEKKIDKDGIEYTHSPAFAAVNVNGETCMYSPKYFINMTCDILNYYRDLYLQTKDKTYWWQMIQLLPSSYNQKRTIMMNYEVLAGIYDKRRHHKLDEWREFCDWIEKLPYSEIITGVSNINEQDLTPEIIFKDFLKWYPNLAGDVSDYRPCNNEEHRLFIYTRHNRLIVYDWKSKKYYMHDI